MSGVAVQEGLRRGVDAEILQKQRCLCDVDARCARALLATLQQQGVEAAALRVFESRAATAEGIGQQLHVPKSQEGASSAQPRAKSEGPHVYERALLLAILARDTQEKHGLRVCDDDGFRTTMPLP